MCDVGETMSPASPEENPEEESIDSHDSSPVTPKINDGDPKHQDEEKHFATIEGELLDFEDFNEKPNEIDSTVDAKNSDSEDGQCDTPEGNAPEKEGSVEEGEDEGMCSEEEDLEEGEISSEKKGSSQMAVCRFFHRGMCYYGSACRFLHPNDTKGNYNMFDQAPRVYPDSFSRMSNSMNHRRSVPFIPTPPAPAYEEESAWERGLKEAKVLLKKANERKDEPDFEEKRLNMGLASKKSSPDYDKENDSSPKRDRRKNSGERRYKPKYEDIYDYPREFDPYSKESYLRGHESEKDSQVRWNSGKSPGERFPKSPRHRWNHSRSEDMKARRPDHTHQYFDPWQRSRSPIRNRTSRSVSCSPVSSYSRSSRSSRSYSRSSSPSSYASSRKSSSSRSRSRSRSISMDSVSSASSHDSPTRTVSFRQRKEQTSHWKGKPEDLYPKSPPQVKVKVEEKREVQEETFHKPLDIASAPSFQHLLPDFRASAREPVKGLHKQNIKLTLLNKSSQSKPPKKDSDLTKKPDPPKVATKRSLSPDAPAAKKSASSRRDDLLKQLKAVEDAIARKRSKC